MNSLTSKTTITCENYKNNDLMSLKAPYGYIANGKIFVQEFSLTLDKNKKSMWH